MPGLGQIANIFDALQREQRRGHLQEFDINETAYEILSSKTSKQIKLLNALLMNDNYLKLREVLKDWNFPLSQEYADYINNCWGMGEKG